jgi:hypothetical protein
MPPGQFPFKDQGVFFKGDCDFPTQVHRVMSFRKANTWPRSSYAEVAEDLSVYTCARLGGDPSFCHDSAADQFSAASPSIAQPKAPCGSCGKKKKS